MSVSKDIEKKIQVPRVGNPHLDVPDVSSALEATECRGDGSSHSSSHVNSRKINVATQQAFSRTGVPLFHFPSGNGTDLAQLITRPEEERPSGSQNVSAYGRRRPQAEAKAKRNDSNPTRTLNCGTSKRTSWNRSLSIRGRESIVFAGNIDLRIKPKQRGWRKKLNQKSFEEQTYDFSKEKAYFEEVDAFELLEESPSPNKFSWKMGTDCNCIEHDLASILDRWRRLKLFALPGTSLPLSKIMESIPISSGHTNSIGSVKYGVACSLSQIRETPTSEISSLKDDRRAQNFTGKRPQSEVASNCAFNQRGFSSWSVNKNLIEELSADSTLSSFSALQINDEAITTDESKSAAALTNENTYMLEKVGFGREFVSFPPKSIDREYLTAFEQLLIVCQQDSPIKLSEAFFRYCDASHIIKLGEGTYGEAFRAGEMVCKVVPIDGDLMVNGEVQKKSEEVLEEVLLSLMLNSLRGQDECNENGNSCMSFIETKYCLVCEGAYDSNLIRAWEDWDVKNTSDNDHPRAFPEEQRYIVFVLADGGKDLENFILQNFDEARSLLLQVTAALAVAESACEFEHRDLHWGNILLLRNDAMTVNFTLEGKKIGVNTFGLMVTIIDFTLSRINTGEAILFFNLSADPELFKGNKGDVQSETYRKMKEVTGECWEERYHILNILPLYVRIYAQIHLNTIICLDAYNT
ncbi:hypothetical protein HPP92_001014 [Vanilla planifolia]|uniref:Protein kinase domain-containing protein n=1 Tax=Vanilla planifolia TaxID=51239 RepID=A0A835SC77_VANPL|nr:hypothetical protein HPP92_001014 [Vanilla planifolia]